LRKETRRAEELLITRSLSFDDFVGALYQTLQDY
jgi:hypothetical protein